MQHKLCRRLTSMTALCALLFAPTAQASSWSPTLLVNTEAFQSIDEGDGSTDIELRFGNTGKEIRWSVGEATFKFDDNVEVIGTASGRLIHAQDKLTTSGSLVVEEGKTISLNGVAYMFPYGDGTGTGKTLKTDGAGNLSWSDDLNSGASYFAGQGLTLSSGFFSVGGSLSGTSLNFTTISGSTIHAEGSLTSSGDIVGEGDLFLQGGNINFGASTTIGDGGDQITIDSNGTLVINDATVDLSAQITAFTLNNAANALNFDSDTLTIDALNNRVGVGTSAPDTAFEVVGTISGSTLRGTDSITSSGSLSIEGGVAFGTLTSCIHLQTDGNGVLSCNNTDYITEAEMDDMSELETQIGGSNIITSGEIDSESEFEAVTGLAFFTAEEVEDRVNTLLRAGTGITLTYDDAGNAMTIHAAAGSGAMYLSPEYDGATYYGDGTSNVGQMVLAYDATNKENFYKWSSTNAALQDYNVAVRVRVPENFGNWKATPIQLRYRSNAASTNDNKITMTMLDTAGNAVSLTGGADLANTSWTTASVTGPEASGVFTPGQYFTILMQLFARTTNTGEAHAGYINLNWSTNR